LEYRTAAALRYREGLSLAESGYRTAAIYLWGYVAESLLKAAILELQGFRESQTVQVADLFRLKQQAQQQLSVSWGRGNLHDIASWAFALIEYRRSRNLPYATPFVAARVLQHANNIHARWNESLRYKTNRAFFHEAKTVAMSAHWFLSNATSL
jgi:hypothetical protein